jgi:hypothetical protein
MAICKVQFEMVESGIDRQHTTWRLLPCPSSPCNQFVADADADEDADGDALPSRGRPPCSTHHRHHHRRQFNISAKAKATMCGQDQGYPHYGKRARGKQLVEHHLLLFYDPSCTSACLPRPRSFSRRWMSDGVPDREGALLIEHEDGQ